MDEICCGERMVELGGARRCRHCGAQSSRNPNAIAPTHVYVQPGVENPPPLAHLTGAMGRSKNGPFTEE